MFYQVFREILEEKVSEYKKSHNASKIEEKAREQACTVVFTVALFVVFQLIKHIAESVGLELLSPTFAKLLNDDSSKASRVVDLAIALEASRSTPKNKAIALHDDLEGEYFTQSLVRVLVLDNLYLYDVRMQVKQELCKKLKIDIPKASFDPGLKRLQ
ncbi:hypothetical protein [Lacipirellula limnantheis]|uniref:Uncharacterized protein n=1 Tax=Lacipirellula limnantheis TaxID=2528024 RepID=A0A517TT59_9BACT|nr:hypothetical protein [Lacipirellula limnantheis]QDT71556.1 hypothetical protein I41_07150 [Lacipirellula limnantheis]